MGKASKWIRNLLMGKSEDKGHDACPSVTAGTYALDIPVGITPVNTPKVKGRWSFKRLTSKKARSFNSSILMPKQALLEYWTHPILLNEYAAATKIQAIYRSYLARRALRALRALVKLQALVRGHLVRKQMNTIVRSMHAVMAIQVRARIHRIQTAPVTPQKGRRKSFTESSPSDIQSRKQISEYITSGSIRGTGGHMDHTLIERVESNTRIRTFDPLTFSQREQRLKMCPSPSASSFTDSSCTAYDRQLKEFSLKMACRNSRRYSTFPENKHLCIPPPAQSHFLPNYMNNTKSSEAKARSHSEPKQRPKLGTKQKSRQSSSMDGNNDKENQYLWLTKLYHRDKSTNDGDSDSNITVITRKSPIPIELPGQVRSSNKQNERTRRNSPRSRQHIPQ